MSYIGVLVLLLALSVAPRFATESSAAPAAVLGGDITSFDALVGPANDHSDLATRHYQRCPGSNVDQLVVTSTNGTVILVLRQPCGSALSTQGRLEEAVTFIPQDAIAIDTFVAETGEPAREFFSPTLADAVDADLFHDCAGEPVTPGIFSIVLTRSGGWATAFGTCP